MSKGCKENKMNLYDEGHHIVISTARGKRPTHEKLVRVHGTTTRRVGCKIPRDRGW